MTSDGSSTALIRQSEPQTNDAGQDIAETRHPSSGMLIPPAGTVMEFWAALYDDSLNEFKARYPEPKGRAQSPYNIRGAKDWNTVYSQLQVAREAYDGSKKGFWGNVKRATRGVADYAASATRLAKFIPEGELTTPIRAAVEVLLDATKVASAARKKIRKSLDGENLERIFNDIELFLATFPSDRSVNKASIKLVVAIMKAIEDAIGFFTQNTFTRGFSAVIHGEKYQESLLDSINEVVECSNDLVHQALNSHIATTRDSMKSALEGTIRIEAAQQMTSKDIKSLLYNMNRSKDRDARAFNHILSLLDDNTKLLLERLNVIQEETERQGRLMRQMTPSPQPVLQSHWPPPHTLQQAPIQILPSSGQQLQLPWISSNQIVYATTVPVQVQPVWVAQPAIEQFPASSMIHHRLCKLLGMEDTDNSDLAYTMDSSDLTPARYRNRMELITRTQQFRDWLVTPTSRELLVQGDNPEDVHASSALMLLCATLIRALRRRPRYIGLVFFCSRHIEEDEGYIGGSGIIRSFIVQLLRSHVFDLAALQHEIDWRGIQCGEIAPTCALFSSLVRRLSIETTLACLIDGIAHYENDEYEEGMLTVLKQLLYLARDGRIPATVKVLVTSSSLTDKVQEAFKDDDSCFLSVAELPWISQGFGMLQLDDDSDDGYPENLEDEDN